MYKGMHLFTCDSFEPVLVTVLLLLLERLQSIIRVNYIYLYTRPYIVLGIDVVIGCSVSLCSSSLVTVPKQYN